MNADHPSIDKSKKASYPTQLLAGRSQGTPCPGTVQAAVPVAARAVICRLPGASWSTSKVINVTVSRKPRLLAALASPQSSLDFHSISLVSITVVHERSWEDQLSAPPYAIYSEEVTRPSPHSRGQEVALKRGALKNLWQLNNYHKHPLAYGENPP